MICCFQTFVVYNVRRASRNTARDEGLSFISGPFYFRVDASVYTATFCTALDLNSIQRISVLCIYTFIGDMNF